MRRRVPRSTRIRTRRTRTDRLQRAPRQPFSGLEHLVDHVRRPETSHAWPLPSSNRSWRLDPRFGGSPLGSDPSVGSSQRPYVRTSGSPTGQRCGAPEPSPTSAEREGFSKGDQVGVSGLAAQWCEGQCGFETSPPGTHCGLLPPPGGSAAATDAPPRRNARARMLTRAFFGRETASAGACLPRVNNEIASLPRSDNSPDGAGYTSVQGEVKSSAICVGRISP